MDNFFQILETRDRHLRLLALKRVVLVAVTDATLDHLVIQREDKGEALNVENSLDEFEHGHRLLGQASIQVIDEDDEINGNCFVKNLLVLRVVFLLVCRS